jgi:2'-5' RNA ligase
MLRLNIHLALDEQTTQFCLQVNTNIRRITNSAIVFSNTSPMIPHITLVMGDCVPSQTFEAVTKATETLVQKMKPLTLKLDQPHISPLKGRFVLCNIQEDSALTALRMMMREGILGTYLTTPYACPPSPHITLAHIYRRQEKVHSYLKSINELPQVVCSHIEISHVRPLGVCIDRLCAFHLEERDDRELLLRGPLLSLASGVNTIHPSGGVYVQSHP